jgi:Cu+-exporting ATPase
METTIGLSASSPPQDIPTVILSIEGMTCASCAAHIERKLKTVPRVKDARVNFASRRAYVELESGPPDLKVLEQAVEEAGYLAKPYAPRSQEKYSQLYQKEQTRLGWRLLLGSVLILPFLIAHLSMFLKPMELSPWVQALLSAPVYFIVGWPFHEAAWKALKHGQATMDSLVSLGSSVAFFSSLPILFRQSIPSYFDAAAFILFFIALGRYLENLSKRRVNRALQSLMDLQPKVAHVLRETHQVDMPVEDVKTGDTFYVRPGELVPVDGYVKEGKGWVDESLLTGESQMAEKRSGSKVFGGTLNGQTALVLKASAIGDQMVLSQMIRMVEEAQGSKAPVQKLVDQIAAVFVPVVLALALLTALGWIFAAHQTWPVGLQHGGYWGGGQAEHPYPPGGSVGKIQERDGHRF